MREHVDMETRLCCLVHPDKYMNYMNGRDAIIKCIHCKRQLCREHRHSYYRVKPASSYTIANVCPECIHLEDPLNEVR